MMSFPISISGKMLKLRTYDPNPSSLLFISLVWDMFVAPSRSKMHTLYTQNLKCTCRIMFITVGA